MEVFENPADTCLSTTRAEAIVVKAPGVTPPAEQVTVAIQPGRVHLFDAATGRRLDPAIS